MKERSPAARRLTPEGSLCFSIPPASRFDVISASTRDFRFPSRLNPLAGRTIINAQGKPNRRGGGLLWDDHNIWAASSVRFHEERREKERENTCSLTPSQSRTGKTFDSLLAREERLSRMWIGRKVRGVDENVTLKENYVGGRESVACGSVPLVN